MSPRFPSPLARCALACAASLLVLSACGGGDDGPSDRTLQSSAAYTHAASLSGVGKALLLRYRMPAVRGGHTQASALLFVPQGRAPAGGWPLVVWAHGTTGVADGCAPSRDYDADQDKDMAQALLDAGFAVLAPDYEGLGAPGMHPYLSLPSQGRSITHAVKAAHGAGVPLARAWGLMGHSQGGFAALAAAQFAPEIAHDFPLRATVAMAPGTDIADSSQELFTRIDALQARYAAEPSDAVGAELLELTLLTAYNGTMVAYGLQAQDPALEPGRVLVDGFLPVAAKAVDDADCQAFSAALLADVDRHLKAGGDPASYPAVRRDLLQRAGVAQAFARNRAGLVKLEAPVLYLQGAQDTQVPVQTARRTAATMQAAGSDVTYIEVADGTHQSIIRSLLPDALHFLRTRLAP